MSEDMDSQDYAVEADKDQLFRDICDVCKVEQFVITTVKLYHQKEKEAFEDMINAVVYSLPYPKRKGASVDRVWFWGLKRWGKYFADKEYDIRESK